MKKTWYLNSYNKEKDENILLNKLLKERGISSRKEREIYLGSDLEYLSDPYLLPEMEQAVSRIKEAIKKNEKILVYGDYDVDGITSTALLYHFFKKKYEIEIDYFLPDRIEDGYGLNKNSLKKIKEKNIDLIITVDCGITAVEEAEYLKELEVDLIITDHHTPADKLPTAAAVINHHLVKAENYFAAEIAGVGTAFKLAQALNNSFLSQELLDLLPLAALGTVADIAPLKAENRILVKNGLEKIKENKNLGLKTLIEKLKIDKSDVSAGQIAFIIAPPLNAAGRLHSAEKALKLLITEDKNEAKTIAEQLVNINKKRQKEEEQIYKQAEAKLKEIDLNEEKSIILADENWHSGIIGIVASRLLEKYNLPVILFAVNIEKGIAKGSARSISKLNIYQALKYCQSEIIDFGGHKAAAGLSVKNDKIKKFKNKFKEYLKLNLETEDYLKVKKIDLNLELSQLNKGLISKIEKFRPFGIANPAPKFLFENIKVNNCYQIGKENKHLKFSLDFKVQAIAFNMGENAAEISANNIDLIAQPEINRWNGQESIQLKIDDYRVAEDPFIPLIFKTNNYNFYDLRNTNKKFKLLNQFLNNNVIKKAAVYIHHKKEIEKLKSKHATHYFFSSKFSNQENFSHLIFYTLPFSLEQFISIISDFNSITSNKRKKIILLFSEKEVEFNSELIKHNCPDQNMIIKFYDLIKQDQKITPNKLKEKYRNSNQFELKNNSLFKKMISFLEAQSLIAVNEQELGLETENELDFKASIRYNKLSRRMENFIIFKDLIFKENLFDLITNVSNFKEDKNES